MQAIEAWQREIEALDGSRVVVVRVETDPVENVLRIAPAFPGRELVAGLLSDSSFVTQLLRAHALSVNSSPPAGPRFHFVLLNQARSADWSELEDSLLAHEFGHIWLDAMGYRALAPADPLPCAAIHASDIVQHVLIREITAARGFDYMRFWTRMQEAWLRREEGARAGPVEDVCSRMQLLSAKMDALLGTTEAGWPARKAYLDLVAARYPWLNPVAAELEALLHEADLWDRSLYQVALWRTLDAVNQLRGGAAAG